MTTQHYASGRFTPTEEHRMGVWMGPRIILEFPRRETYFASARTRTPDHSAPNTVTIMTTIIQLLNPVYLILFRRNGHLGAIRDGKCRSQWPNGLRRGSAAARLPGLRVRIPLGAWMFVCCKCCVLSLRRADHSSRGVLPTVLCHCV